jgi:hypothetical protein
MACEQSNQRLTFCGVNAHFQNGIAETAIQDLSKSARNQLLHTRQRWPQVVSIAFWPYALCYTAHLHNVLPVLKDGRSRLEMFSSIQVGLSMKTLHTFGCPVFALYHALAGGKSISRWDPRSCNGLYLGPSPLHARNVHLVLSLTTGLVSLQFHCCFDDFFETCKYGVSDMGVSSTRQHLAGLKRANGDPWIHPDQRLLSCAPISKMGNTSKSQLPMSKILLSKPQDEQSVSSEFFDDGDVAGI